MLYSYWQPGAITGSVIAMSPQHAARIVLNTPNVHYVRGDLFTQPWQYVTDGPDHQEIKIWESQKP